MIVLVAVYIAFLLTLSFIFYLSSDVRRQFLFMEVCLEGCTFRPFPYTLKTVQNGAHFVCFEALIRRFFFPTGLLRVMVVLVSLLL